MSEGAICEIDISFAAPTRIEQNQQFIINFIKNVGANSFQKAIRIIQAAETNPEIPPVMLQWNAPETTFSKSLADIMDVSAFPEDWKISEADVASLTHEFHCAKKLIDKFLPATSSSIEKLVFSYLFAKRSGYEGGSVSNRIGMVWLNPTKAWSTCLWAENIVHEFIHNALFLEDMVHQVFPLDVDSMAKEGALCLSAIRKVRRGYDKSFHSAFVSLGIINFYKTIDRREKAKKYVIPLLHCVNELSSRDKVLSEHGRALLRELAIKTIACIELLRETG